MRKRKSMTIVERAKIAVPGFEGVVRKPGQQVTLRGQSKYKKDRIVPLSPVMAKGLRKYLQAGATPHMVIQWQGSGESIQCTWFVVGYAGESKKNDNKEGSQPSFSAIQLCHASAGRRGQYLPEWQLLFRIIQD